MKVRDSERICRLRSCTTASGSFRSVSLFSGSQTCHFFFFLFLFLFRSIFADELRTCYRLVADVLQTCDRLVAHLLREMNDPIPVV